MVKFYCGTTTTGDVIKLIEGREGFPTTEIVCVQGLEDHSVLVSFRTEGPVECLLEEDVIYIDRVPVLITRPDVPKLFVKVHYLHWRPTGTSSACVGIIILNALISLMVTIR